LLCSIDQKEVLIVLKVEGIEDFEIRILIWVNWNRGNSKHIVWFILRYSRLEVAIWVRGRRNR
jgi:hypothetical protein